MTQDGLVGVCFPVVKVRFAGPTDYRGSRYIASVRGVRITRSYDHALSGPENAYRAAADCWSEYVSRLSDDYCDPDRVFVPGDLDADTYAFTVVPVGFLS